jgi:acetyl-CoA C-acetyltransferase
VFIAGVGQTAVNKDPQSRGRYLGAAAVKDALADAGIETKTVGALYVGNMLSGILAQQQQLGGLIADYTGLAGIEAVTVEAACASGGAAVRMAYQAVAGGIHDVVAVCGVERMTHVERDVATRALATAADWELEGVCGESFLSLNATLMRAYMTKHGVASALRAVRDHRASERSDEPNALLQAARSRAYLQSRHHGSDSPVRRFAGLQRRERRHPRGAACRAALHGRSRVRIALGARWPRCARAAPRSLDLTAVTSSTQQAMKQAGVGHDDIDLFEPHDVHDHDGIGARGSRHARPGEGVDYADADRIGLRGELPLATFGGLKARGHPVGASGCYQIVEAFLQLCERAGANQVPGAAVALVQNIGGTGATVVSHVLARDD